MKIFDNPYTLLPGEFVNQNIEEPTATGYTVAIVCDKQGRWGCYKKLVGSTIEDTADYGTLVPSQVAEHLFPTIWEHLNKEGYKYYR